MASSAPMSLTIGRHRVVEVEVDPLGHVEFVLVVLLADQLYQVVGLLAHGHDLVASLHVLQREVPELEREVEDVDQAFYTAELTNYLLMKRELEAAALFFVVVVFAETLGQVEVVSLQRTRCNFADEEALDRGEQFKIFVLLLS